MRIVSTVAGPVSIKITSEAGNTEVIVANHKGLCEIPAGYYIAEKDALALRGIMYVGAEEALYSMQKYVTDVLPGIVKAAPQPSPEVVKPAPPAAPVEAVKKDEPKETPASPANAADEPKATTK